MLLTMRRLPDGTQTRACDKGGAASVARVGSVSHTVRKPPFPVPSQGTPLVFHACTMRGDGMQARA